ncbi:esterase/lipase family protein [Agromyces humi]|uniref:esterase/lipase family protein n=1 Tax=Agromyces humi TaxID=1766800 RepID=UPI00135CF084|nr:hypothetical protein [Agromyces humi]
MSHRKVMLAAAAILLTAAATLAAPPAIAASCNAGFPSNVDLAGKHVALLAHGWNGAELVRTRQLLQDELDDAWAVGTFSYPDLNAQWPDKSGAAQCLQQAIRDVHTRTGSTDANVYLVAHSMGGILARFATNSSDDPSIDDIVAGVVTLDTPHRGSPMGATNIAAMLQLANGGGFGDGSKCLAPHHPGSLPTGCGYAPYLSPDIPVAQIVGDVTITRNFFAFGFSGLDTNGDGVVWVNSQSGYDGSSEGPAPGNAIITRQVDCESALAVLAAHQGSRLNLANPLSVFGITGSKQVAAGDPILNTNSTAVAMLGAIAKTTACGHTGMTENPQAITMIADSLRSMPARTAAWVIDGTGFGPVKIGGTLDAAKAEPSVTVEDLGSPWCGSVNGDGWWSAEAPAGEGSDLVSVILIGSSYNGEGEPARTSGAPATAAGITIGSTAEEVFVAYPDARLANEQYSRSARFPDYQDYVVEINGGPVVLGTEGGVVDAIMIGQEGIPYELCS